MIRAILACDINGGISQNGIMPWDKNKTDLQRFVSVTASTTVVMGRSTWEAADMPAPLPNRKNIIVTHDCMYNANATILCNNVADTLIALSATEQIIIIGGAALLHSLIDIVDIIHLTMFSQKYNCDTFVSLKIIQDKFNIIEQIQMNQNIRFDTYVNKQVKWIDS